MWKKCLFQKRENRQPASKEANAEFYYYIIEESFGEIDSLAITLIIGDAASTKKSFNAKKIKLGGKFSNRKILVVCNRNWPRVGRNGKSFC